MKNLFFFILLLPLVSLAQRTTYDTTISSWNAKVTYDPSKADSSEGIIYFPGAGEVGTDASQLLKYGPHYWLLNGWDGGVVLGNGTHYPIYISLQPPSQSVLTGPNVKVRLDAILARYKIKRKAFYLTGPSAGGFASWTFVTYQPTAGDHSYGDMVTAIMCPESVKPNSQQGATPAYPQNTVQWIQRGKYALGFNQINDGGRDMQAYYSAMNTAAPGHATYYSTDFSGGGHCCFEEFWNPYSNDWNSSNQSMSLPVGTGIPTGWTTYQWLLRKGDTSIGAAPATPIVTGSGDASLTLPVNSAAIGCTVTSGTSPYVFAWAKAGGPDTYSFSNRNSQNPTVSGLVAGNYVFRVLVTDAKGQTGTADVSINVSSGAIEPPFVTTTGNQTIQLPASSVTLDASGSTAGTGTITNYQWTQTGGPAVTIGAPGAATTTVNGFALTGTYTFNILVTNSSNASASADVTVSVIDNATGYQKDAWIYIYSGANGYSDPQWTPWNAANSSTINTVHFIDGSQSPWTLSLSSGAVVDNGGAYATTATGPIAPPGVLRFATYQSTGARSITISKLDTSGFYTIEAIGSRSTSTPNKELFWIGTDTVSLSTSNNFSASAPFYNRKPSSGGTIVLNFTRASNQTGTYVNAIRIQQQGQPVNHPPSAFAGQDQLVSLPEDSITVAGVGSDPDDGDSVVAYHWEVLDGPRQDSLQIVNPDSARTVIRNLVVGSYTFQLTVYDVQGAAAVDTLRATVTSDTGAVMLVLPKDTTLALSQPGGHGDETLRDTTQLFAQMSTGPNATNFKWSQDSGPSILSFVAPTGKGTNIFGFVPGNYVIRGKTYNLTDSATAIFRVRVVDYQTAYSVHPCRTGAPKTWILTPTAPGQMVKMHLYRDVYLNDGSDINDRILGGDTVKIPGGTYTFFNLSGFGGSEGCHVQVVPIDVVTISSSSSTLTPYFRIGSGDDSARVSFAHIDGSYLLKSKGILYGFRHTNPIMIPAAIGITCNATDHTEINNVYINIVGIGLFNKVNPDSTHPWSIFNKTRQTGNYFHNIYFDSVRNEIVYSGNTSINGIVAAGGDGPSVRVDTTMFKHNYLNRGGYDGFQNVNSVYEEVEDNWFFNLGTLNVPAQRYATSMGGNTTGWIMYNFMKNLKEGIGLTPYGKVIVAYNYIDSVLDGGFGAGRGHGLTGYGAATGTQSGSTIVEPRPPFYAWIYGNIARKCDSFYFRLHNQDGANSVTDPSLIYDNDLIDSTGRTLAQLISNYSGSQYNTNNRLHTVASFPIRIQDNSNPITGPSVTITQGDATQTFTSAQAAVLWLRSRLVPPTVLPCNCQTLTNPFNLKNQ